MEQEGDQLIGAEQCAGHRTLELVCHPGGRVRVELLRAIDEAARASTPVDEALDESAPRAARSPPRASAARRASLLRHGAARYPSPQPSSRPPLRGLGRLTPANAVSRNWRS